MSKQKNSPYAKAAFSIPLKRSYICPRLVTYGKMHSLVAAGSGINVEGAMMTSLMRRA